MLRAVRNTLVREVAALAVTGEDGHGKTSLIGPLRTLLGGGFTVGLLPPGPEGGEVQRILGAFAPRGAAWTRLEARRALGDLLEKRRGEGRPCVLIVDDAHRASEPMASALAKLLDAGADGGAGLKVVLMAPAGELRRSPMRTLPSVEVRAGPLRPEEAVAYVRHRLRAAGGPADLFDEAAALELGSASGGVPDALNRLGSACLDAAAPRGARSIGVEAVRAASRTMRGAPPGGTPSRGTRPDPTREAESGAAVEAMSPAHPRTPEGPDEFLFSPSRRLDPVGGDRRAREGAKPAAVEPVSAPEAPSAPSRLGGADPFGPGRALGLGEERGAEGRVEREVLRDAGAARGPDGVRAAAAEPVAARGASWWPVACAVVAGLAIGVGVSSTLMPPGFTTGMGEMRAGTVPPPAADVPPGRGEASSPPAHAVAAAAEPEAGDAVSVVSAALPAAAPDREAEARALYARAVDLAAEDPQAAVVAYARAALRGHVRSARYLGQIYEIGDGVEVSPALARAWYGFAEAGPAAARGGLPEGAPGPGRSSDVPVPTFSARMPDGAVELVWSGAGGGAGYRVEFARDPLEGLAGSLDAAVSAALATVPEDVGFWRVAAANGSSEGGWTPIGGPAAP